MYYWCLFYCTALHFIPMCAGSWKRRCKTISIYSIRVGGGVGGGGKIFNRRGVVMLIFFTPSLEMHFCFPILVFWCCSTYYTAEWTVYSWLSLVFWCVPEALLPAWACCYREFSKEREKAKARGDFQKQREKQQIEVTNGVSHKTMDIRK